MRIKKTRPISEFFFFTNIIEQNEMSAVRGGFSPRTAIASERDCHRLDGRVFFDPCSGRGVADACDRATRCVLGGHREDDLVGLAHFEWCSVLERDCSRALRQRDDARFTEQGSSVEGHRDGRGDRLAIGNPRVFDVDVALDATLRCRLGVVDAVVVPLHLVLAGLRLGLLTSIGGGCHRGGHRGGDHGKAPCGALDDGPARSPCCGLDCFFYGHGTP